MLSNSVAYQVEVQYRRQQLREDLARRQQVEQAKLAGRDRKRIRGRRRALAHVQRTPIPDIRLRRWRTGSR